jgi:protein-tyrosine phosphatase
VCTGNYYRSRFAEIYFNHFSRKRNLKVHAFSRGLEAEKARNLGSISKYTIQYLEALQIPFDSSRMPRQITEIDFLISDRVVIMDNTEHRPMLERYFPDLEHPDLHFWEYPDIQFKSPETILPKIARSTTELINSMSKHI